MKYAAATTVVVFLIVAVFLLNALVPLFVDRIQQVLP